MVSTQQLYQERKPSYVIKIYLKVEQTNDKQDEERQEPTIICNKNRSRGGTAK